MQYLGESKNLFPQYMYIGTTSTNNGVSAIGLPNGMIRITGTSTARPQITVLYDRDYYLPAGTYSCISPQIERGCNIAYAFTLADGTRKTMYCTGPNKITLEQDVVKISLFFFGFTDPAIYTYDLVCPIMLVKYDGYYVGEYRPYLDGNPIQDVQRSENLVNEDILVEYGAEKLANGEYYFKFSSTPYRKHLWDNTENYQGQLTLSYTVKYVKGALQDNDLFGVSIIFYYTDGTMSYWGARDKYDEYYTKSAISNATKTISYIACSYGTGFCQTYLKNIMINYGDTALPYQPYLQHYNMYMYDNLIKQPYYDGLSKTQNGITFTVDEQTGWVTVNGTASAETDFNLTKPATKFLIPANCILKGCPNGGSSTTYQIQVFTTEKNPATNNYKNFSSYGENKNDINTHGEFFALWVRIQIRINTTVNNLIFKPELIRLAGD